MPALVWLAIWLALGNTPRAEEPTLAPFTVDWRSTADSRADVSFLLDARTASDRIFEVFDEENTITDPTSASRSQGDPTGSGANDGRATADARRGADRGWPITTNAASRATTTTAPTRAKTKA